MGLGVTFSQDFGLCPGLGASMRPTLTAQPNPPRVIPWIESSVASVSISETYSFGPGLPGTPYPYRTPVPLLVPPT